MSHVAQIGRRAPRVRAGMALLYAVILMGAVTTLYPFLLMVSTGTKSQTDYNEYSPQSLVPRYLRDDNALYQKYLEDRYASNMDDLNAAHNADYSNIPDTKIPAQDPESAGMVTTWNRFAKRLSLYDKKPGFGEHDNAPSRLLDLYRDHLRTRFHNNIAELNKVWMEENIAFDGVTPPFERTALRDYLPDLSTDKMRDWTTWKQNLPQQFLIVSTVDPLFRAYLRQDVYEESLPKLNKAWKSNYTKWTDIFLSRQCPDAMSSTPGYRKDWETFVRTKFPLRMLTLDKSANGQWRQFLAAQKPPVTQTAPLPPTLPENAQDRRVWADFITHAAPLSALSADSPDNLWRAHLPLRMGFAHIDEPPQADADAAFVRANRASLRGEFATRNYRSVARRLVSEGQSRAVINTIIYCLLAILAAVIVNPLCAYALSRYPLPYAGQVLLFLLATMAFPAEVAMIPNFLLLRDLHLLNTFWALVLPGLASGFSIFLLKGFFDSLPRELYEAGILDGATEITMFRRITIPLSLPIFSVIALNAFTGAYGAFLFALVTCQNPKMWTLMVWLYNLQDSAPQYVIMAALTLAALPTLVIFLCAQKVILRGIILPSFK